MLSILIDAVAVLYIPFVIPDVPLAAVPEPKFPIFAIVLDDILDDAA